MLCIRFRSLILAACLWMIVSWILPLFFRFLRPLYVVKSSINRSFRLVWANSSFAQFIFITTFLIFSFHYLLNILFLLNMSLQFNLSSTRSLLFLLPIGSVRTPISIHNVRAQKRDCSATIKQKIHFSLFIESMAKTLNAIIEKLLMLY